MSQKETVFEMDPVEQLDEIKKGIQQKITATKLLLAEEKKKLRELEKLNIETVSNKPKLIAEQKQQIIRTTEKLAELDQDLKALNRTREDENEEKTQAALHKVMTDWIDKDQSAAYVIEDQEFTFIREYSSIPDKQNVQLRRLEPARFQELLASELNLKTWHLPPHRIKDLFNDAGRTFHMSRYSIDPSRWKNNQVYLPITHMEQHFINKFPAEFNPADPDLKYFDWLMYSLSGGKQENQDHIEQWILHKIKNYKKAVTTPDIVIVGHVGGNGKGIIQAIIRLMLPAMLSGKANSKTLNSNFNAIMLGKLIVFFDDQNSKEIPLEVVKQLAGAETMIFEPKGKDQYEGEKTHSSAWFNNDLPFKLTPAGLEGGVDRRFSIMRTNITFLESIRLHYKQDYEQVMSVEESKEAAELIVSSYLLNRTIIAKWFKLLEFRHPQVTEDFVLKPLHGADYQYFLAKQESSIEKIWKKLIQPVLEQGGCVPIFVIKELLRHMEGREISDKTIQTKLDEISSQNKIEVERARHKIDIRSVKLTVKKQCTVLRPKAAGAWRDHGFDWNLVSNITYTGDVPVNHELIHEDNLVFDTRLDTEEE